MAQKRIKTKVRGVRYREHDSRKHGLLLDRYFIIRYRVDGKEKEEGLGWASEGWTLARAADTLSELKRNARTGDGEKTLGEKRAKAEEAKQAEIDRQKAEVEAAEAAEHAEVERLRLEQNTRIDVVFKKYCSVKSDKKSLKAEKVFYSKWIEPAIGDKCLDAVSVDDIEKIVKTMKRKGRTPRTRQYVLAIIRQLFRYAETKKIFKGDIPTKGVFPGKIDNVRIRFLKEHESVKLMAELKQRSEQTWQMAVISLDCGLRFSEIAKLTWQHVDTDSKSLTLVSTKNGTTRAAFMTEEVLNIFLAMERGLKNELVFPDQFGKVMTRISPAFFRAINHLGLNDNVDDPRTKLVFHSLRHTYGSRLIKSGADMAVVRDLLGHKDFGSEIGRTAWRERG